MNQAMAAAAQHLKIIRIVSAPETAGPDVMDFKKPCMLATWPLAFIAGGGQYLAAHGGCNGGLVWFSGLADTAITFCLLKSCCTDLQLSFGCLNSGFAAFITFVDVDLHRRVPATGKVRPGGPF